MTDYAVHAIINGSLDMSPGKIAAQTFQACQRLYERARHDPDLRARLELWERAGTKTVIHVAATSHVFQRAAAELPGALMVDEGVNEIAPDSPTIFATAPMSRAEQPKILSHKRIQVWRS